MSKGQSYYDWERSFKEPRSMGSSIGLSKDELKDFMKDWKAKNLKNNKGEEENEVLILDIETTGLDPYDAMICEIGICSLNLDNGRIEPTYNIICQEKNKRFDESSWIFENSDLSIDTVRNAKYLEDHREILQKILNSGYPCTAYNQNFDFRCLEARNFQIPMKFWDPMHKLTSILKIRRYNGSYKWPSVQEAYDYFFSKERYVEQHRALDDAKHEAKIVYATYQLLKKMGYKNED